MIIKPYSMGYLRISAILHTMTIKRTREREPNGAGNGRQIIFNPPGLYKRAWGLGTGVGTQENPYKG